MSAYHTDPKVREAIDKVLHENVKIYPELGVSSTKAERYAAGVKERANLKTVRHLDPEFIDFLIKLH